MEQVNMIISVTRQMKFAKYHPANAITGGYLRLLQKKTHVSQIQITQYQEKEDSICSQ